jgi:hypothetical protein
MLLDAAALFLLRFVLLIENSGEVQHPTHKRSPPVSTEEG